MKNIIENIKNELKNGKKFVLVRIMDSTGGAPRTKDAYMFVDENMKSYGTIGGGRVEYEATLDTKDVFLNKNSDEKSYDLTMEAAENLGMVCGGKIKVKFFYLDNKDENIKLLDDLESETKNKSTVFIFGAGHVSVELAKILEYLDYKVVIWDSRIEFANENRFSKTTKIICDEFKDILYKISINREDFVVIMTRGHVSDYTCLTQVLKSEASYIGVIGSTEKNRFIKEKALNEGFTDEDFKKVHAPIGVKIGAETPEEIAISISSEIILFKSKMENRRKYIENKTLFNTCVDYK